MSRTTAKYLALLALAIVFFHWKTLLTDQFTSIVGFEGVNQTYAWLHFWVRSIWRGHLPLWDPYIFAGRPFTEEMAAFYPVHLLFALVPLNKNGLISPHFFYEYLAFNRFLGACFMFGLLREFRRSHFAAFIGAVAFSMGGLLGRLPWPQYMEACIWLPAIFLFVLRALRSEQRGRAWAEASLAGLCMGMTVLTGGAQFAMIQGVFVVAAIAWYGAVSRPAPDATLPSANRFARAHWLRIAVIFALIPVVAFGAGAVQLLPSLEFGHLSLRAISGGWLPTDQKIPYDRLLKGMWPQSILSGLLPAGAPAGGEESWPYYIGAFPMFLAVTAIWKRWDNLWVRFLSIMALIVFAYTLGEFSPLFGALYALVPWLWMVRGASRFVYLVSFALAVLSAFGLDSLLENAGHREAWATARTFLKWIAIGCAAAVIVPDIFTQVTLGIWPCLSLLLILGSCAWFYRLTLRPAPSFVRFMLAAFVVLDLTSFNWQAADKNDLAKTGDDYVQMVTVRQAADFVKAQPGLSRARVSIASPPDIGNIYGAPCMVGGGAAVLTDFSKLSLHDDLFNVRYQIKPASTPDPGAVYQDARWKVYENKDAFPRAWLVHRTVTEPSDDAVFGRIEKPGIDLHTAAIIQTPLPGALGPARTGESVRFRSYEPDRMALDVSAGGTGLLVLSEVFYPGWRATVNGQPAAIQKVDGALRGIVVPPGSDRVDVEYVPVSFYAGAGLGLFTILCVVLAWVPWGREFFRTRKTG